MAEKICGHPCRISYNEITLTGNFVETTIICDNDTTYRITAKVRADGDDLDDLDLDGNALLPPYEDNVSEYEDVVLKITPAG